MADPQEHNSAVAEKTPREVARQRALGTGIAVLLLAVALVLAVVWAQMGRALQVGEQATDKVDGVTFTLNEEIAAFTGTAATAAEVEPKLRAGQEVLAQQLAPIDSMIGVGSVVDYREALRSYVTSTSDYYSDVLATVTFVIDRSDFVGGIGRAFDALSQAATATTPADILTAIQRAAGEAGTAVDELRSMGASSTAAYVNTALVEHLDALRSALGDLSRGLLTQDTPVISQSGARLGQLLKADWESLFYEADEAALERYSAEADNLKAGRQAIDSARGKIEEQRSLLGLAIVVLALIAALIAGATWLR